MTKRQLRIVRTERPNVLGICDFCNMEFKSADPDILAAGAEVQTQFDAHKCKREDASQAAAQIVRQATEN